MHNNSLKAYTESRSELSARAGQVLDALYFHGPKTARELKSLMGFDDMNAVRPRLTDLKDDLWVRECATTIDHKTKKTVAVYEGVTPAARAKKIEELKNGQLDLL